jgi:hypothetical protein
LKLPPPDGSRDPRIDDPTNVYFVHVVGRALLPVALKLGIPANAVSVAGFLLGAAAAAALYRWERFATAGFLLLVLWLVADGLDGMIARATRTASALGRFLDGVCDHAVFLLVYFALAASLGISAVWTLALCAGAVHAVQASLYEGERMRFHRRIVGDAQTPHSVSANPLVRAYDSVAGSLQRLAEPFDRHLGSTADRQALATRYGTAAAPALRLMSLLSNNMRVLLIWAACLAGNPRLFWWIELGPLTVLAAAGILWHRWVERRLMILERQA